MIKNLNKNEKQHPFGGTYCECLTGDKIGKKSEFTQTVEHCCIECFSETLVKPYENKKTKLIFPPNARVMFAKIKYDCSHFNTVTVNEGPAQLKNKITHFFRLKNV